MGTSNETMTPLGVDVAYRQTISPDYLTSSFTADDADDHIFKVNGRGKGRMTVCVDNPANQSLTVTVYGMHSVTGAIAGTGVVELGEVANDSQFTVANAAIGYETYNDPFPFYLIKVTYAGAPTDTPKKTCTVYINFQGQ